MGPNQDSKTTEEISRQLLDWLDQGASSAGQRYVEVRQRLELYFDRKNCVGPGELADETLDRVARKLEEKGEVTEAVPLEYCYSIAKCVFLDALVAGNRAPFYRPLNTSNGSLPTPKSGSATEHNGNVAACLDNCLGKLSGVDRELIAEYYRGQENGKDEHRAALAGRLGVTVDMLRIRAYRARQKLEACAPACDKEHES